ncbi:MAG: hypothetical protein HC769_09455 [Cyanobacteria bacterium CRU_2_1]|nr:hypothetical protein [Cyanobacteria bacterium CRU_2_1]
MHKPPIHPSTHPLIHSSTHPPIHSSTRNCGYSSENRRKLPDLGGQDAHPTRIQKIAKAKMNAD